MKDECEAYLQENISIEHSEILEITKEIRLLEKQVSDMRNNKSQNSERINLLKNGKCHTCKCEFSPESVEVETKKLTISNKAIDNGIENILHDIKLNEEFLNEANLKNNEIREVKDTLKQELVNINHTLTNIKNNEDLITETENKIVDFNISALQDTYDSMIIEKNNLLNKIEKLRKKIKNLKDSKEVLGDKASKSFLMSKYIPLLNKKVQEYINKFDLNVILRFDDQMQCCIYNPKSPTDELEYESFSKGEKKRMDIAILLSFIKITKEICNWNCNLMFLDELLDGGLDDEGLDKVGIAFKSIVEEDGLCIYTVSQRKLSYTLFSGYLFISRDSDNFSTITQQAN